MVTVDEALALKRVRAFFWWFMGGSPLSGRIKLQLTRLEFTRYFRAHKYTPSAIVFSLRTRGNLSEFVPHKTPIQRPILTILTIVSTIY